MTPHKGPICLFISGSTLAARIESHVIEVASCECGELSRRPAVTSWWGRKRQAFRLQRLPRRAAARLVRSSDSIYQQSKYDGLCDRPCVRLCQEPAMLIYDGTLSCISISLHHTKAVQPAALATPDNDVTVLSSTRPCSCAQQTISAMNGVFGYRLKNLHRPSHA